MHSSASDQIHSNDRQHREKSLELMGQAEAVNIPSSPRKRGASAAPLLSSVSVLGREELHLPQSKKDGNFPVPGKPLDN